MSSYGSAAPGQGATVEAIVKWFNLTKGFGFVAPADGTADAFMHMSVLNRAGMQQIAEGTKLLVEIGDGQKGRQVLRIIENLGMGEVPAGNQRGHGGGQQDGYSQGFGDHGGGGRDHSAATGPTEELTGTVKWFKPEKGFGFVAPDDGGKDIFVHKSVVSRAGFIQLDPGQKLKLQVQTASKGREAVSIQAI